MLEALIVKVLMGKYPVGEGVADLPPRLLGRTAAVSDSVLYMIEITGRQKDRCTGLLGCRRQAAVLHALCVQ